MLCQGCQTSEAAIPETHIDGSNLACEAPGAVIEQQLRQLSHKRKTCEQTPSFRNQDS